MATRERDPGRGEFRSRHVAVGYTDREDLDRFIEAEQGDLVVHGPVLTGEAVADVATMGTGVTEGTPCLVIPLVRERMDEIRREVADVLDRFEAQRPRRPEEARPHTIGETGGSARGATFGAIRLGSKRPDTE